jgi:acyl-CoA dehydrogenase
MATAPTSETYQRALKVGEVAAQHAPFVDAEARFPHEAFAALREAGLLGAMMPKDVGGHGASLEDIADACFALGQSCASTAMIYAMHQIQVACLVRHGLGVPELREYAKRLTKEQLLLASATTEVGIGGDVRSSLCSIERKGDQFRIEKQAPVISYAEHCDDILVTGRRAPDAPSSDQVICLVPRREATLEKIGTWDTLGMRGTCSLGFKVAYEGPAWRVLPQPYAEISAQTMLPTSHITWTSLWLGNATDAVAKARASVRAEARKKPGTVPPSALRLAETVAALQKMRGTVRDARAEYAESMADRDELSSMGFAIRMNNLKICASEQQVDVVARALQVCGIFGYKNDTKYSVGRNLRDAYGAALMVANDRIYSANASMLLVHKDD